MKKMNIVYEDKEILVVDKEAKKLTIATSKEREKTLYHEAREYVKKQYPKNKIFIVHRLDKDTSGLVLFAKNENKKYFLQNNWSNVIRKYYAIVEGTFKEKKGILKSYLVETKTLEVFSTKDKKRGHLAITEYEVMATNDKYSLLKINIKTGRRNQIRVQLSDIGHPIAGDKKYHSKTDPLKRLCLHACYLEYQNNNKTYKFEAKYPKAFKKIFDIDSL